MTLTQLAPSFPWRVADNSLQLPEQGTEVEVEPTPTRQFSPEQPDKQQNSVC